MWLVLWCLKLCLVCCRNYFLSDICLMVYCCNSIWFLIYEFSFRTRIFLAQLHFGFLLGVAVYRVFGKHVFPVRLNSTLSLKHLFKYSFGFSHLFFSYGSFNCWKVKSEFNSRIFIFRYVALKFDSSDWYELLVI